MPSYLFHSDTNQQLFEQDLDDRGIAHERTETIGEVAVEGDWTDLAEALGGSAVN